MSGSEYGIIAKKSKAEKLEELYGMQNSMQNNAPYNMPNNTPYSMPNNAPYNDLNN